MKAFALLAALLGSALATPSFVTAPRRSLSNSGFTIVNPGGLKDVVVSEDNTLNATYDGEPKTEVMRIADEEKRAALPMEFVNNFAGGPINAYISGLDESGAVVFVGGDGTLYYPNSGGSVVPVPITEPIAIPLSSGQSFQLTLPIAMYSTRIYFAEGDLKFFIVSIGDGRDGLVQPSLTNLEDPSAAVNFGFVELTLITEGALWANISFVDFVGLLLGIRLRHDGGQVQETLGLPVGTVQNICNDLVAQQSADGWPWATHCIASPNGTPLRVLSPNDYAKIDEASFSSYWSDYIDQVWDHYSRNDLTINTQNENGLVACRVNNNVLECAGDNRGYQKPVAKDIWGCNSGPFEVNAGDNGIHLAAIPRICSAFYRSILLLDGGNVQPQLGQSAYYTVNPTSHYSRIVHNYLINNRGYTFSYDDVNPDGNENASGTVASGNPELFTVYIGAPPS